jgi:hypothetical protein
MNWKPKCKLCGGDCGLICKKFAAEAPKPKLREIVDAVPARKIPKPGARGNASKTRSAKPKPAAARAGRPKKGAEGDTLSAQKPWEKEGVSRVTWYRRQKESAK